MPAKPTNKMTAAKTSAKFVGSYIQFHVPCDVPQHQVCSSKPGSAPANPERAPNTRKIPISYIQNERKATTDITSIAFT